MQISKAADAEAFSCREPHQPHDDSSFKWTFGRKSLPHAGWLVAQLHRSCFKYSFSKLTLHESLWTLGPGEETLAAPEGSRRAEVQVQQEGAGPGLVATAPPLCAIQAVLDLGMKALFEAFQTGSSLSSPGPFLLGQNRVARVRCLHMSSRIITSNPSLKQLPLL